MTKIGSVVMDKNIDLAKKRLREETADRIRNLDQGYTESADASIRGHILALREYIDARFFFCFIGTKSEIDTSPLIGEALAQKKRVCVPRCTGKGIMHAFEIKAPNDLQPGKYGIAEPKGHCGIVSPDGIDFAIIPCMACDLSGYRLGHGGGYYDRYLARISFTTAAICRSPLLLEEAPRDAHDVRVDLVVTEHGIYRNGQKM